MKGVHNQLALVLLLATSLSRASGVYFEPESAVISAGRVAVFTPHYWPGFVWPPYEYNSLFHFGTDRPDLVAVRGDYMISRGGGQSIEVTGFAPGTARIYIANEYGAISSGGAVMATVTVTCPQWTARAGTAAIAAIVKDAVTLRIVIDGADPIGIDWFRGTSGDVREPLALSGGRSLTIRTDTIGPLNVWASIRGACGAVPVQFSIDVRAPRRRAAGR
jgi:hypothetical protein